MDREIKFRAKKIDSDEWTFGYYQFTIYSKAYQRDYNFNKDEAHYIYPSHIDSHPKEIIINTLGLFTGLKDKNGKEIYEGDIIQDAEENNYVILWDSGDARFVSVNLPDYILNSESRLDEEKLIWVICKIIGNIYDNRELLK